MIDLYYGSDEWDLRNHPNPDVRALFAKKRTPPVLSFGTIVDAGIRAEAKEYIAYIIEEKLLGYTQPERYTIALLSRWRRGIEFLSIISPEYHSVLQDYPALHEQYDHYLQDVCKLKKAGSPRGYRYYVNNFISCLHQYLIRHRGLGDDPLERIVWNRDDLGLAPDRINPTNAVISLSFEFIDDPTDMKCIQKYIRHLVKDTSTSFATICSNLAALKTYVLSLQSHGRTFHGATREDALVYMKEYGENHKANSLDNRIAIIFRAYEYLCVYGILNDNPFSMNDCSRPRYQYQLKTIDDTVIIKIFAVLDQMPADITAMFLLLYTTGMRISEVCQIRNDCLTKNEKGCFIRFYCQKMKKDVMNPIPPALYERIHALVQDNAALPYAETFLFHRLPNKPYYAGPFSARFNALLRQFGITTPDGEPFVFRPHDLRHTLATKMYTSDIDLPVIQSVLHHASIEMTMAYVERSDEHMRRMHHRYLNYRGVQVDEAVESERIDWLRENMRSQLLPNGICGLPINMGRCPHANACLDGCKFFRTSVDYLPAHRQYAGELRAYIELCRDRHWENQQKAAERVMNNVLEIIRQLESTGE